AAPGRNLGPLGQAKRHPDRPARAHIDLSDVGSNPTSLSYNVEIDISQWDRLRSTLEEKFGSTGEALAQFADDRLVPQLEAEAGSQRNVVTGTYSGTWEASAEGDDAAVVTTG